MPKFCFIVLLLFTSNAIAEQKPDPKEVCSNLSELAEVAMKSRQMGMPMREAMDVAGESDLLQHLIFEAYSSPAYSTERMQEKTISEFGSKQYLLCIKAFRS